MNIKPRVYVLEYVFCSLYGKIKDEIRREYFYRSERDKFIDRYLYLENHIHFKDIKTYTSELVEVDMEQIINTI